MKLELLTTLVVLVSPIFAVTAAPNNRGGLFGVVASSHNLPSKTSSLSCNSNILDIRGGAVHESSTLSDLESRIQSAALQDKLTVIDFTATWCGPCKQIAPIYKELSDQFGSRTSFIKVDVDDNPEAAQKYGVSAMPTFLFIKGGEVVDRLMGANSDRLKELIEEWSF